MLEAALLGVPYNGCIPDFGNRCALCCVCAVLCCVWFEREYKEACMLEAALLGVPFEGRYQTSVTGARCYDMLCFMCIGVGGWLLYLEGLAKVSEGFGRAAGGRPMRSSCPN